MADPFEVRMGFTKQLQHLNASVTSAQKAAQYALKHKEQDEDLHSCILEQIERNSMNTRANIMYFIEHFLEMASKEAGHEYVKMMQRDIIRVVDAVCPEDGSGAANVKVVRRVLLGLKTKQVLSEQSFIEIEECLKERDTTAGDMALSSPANAEGAFSQANDSGKNATANSSNKSRNGSASNAATRVDKRQIEQRIEEDRERHKRMRESMWTVPSKHEEEAARMYDEASDMGEDDHIMGREEYDALTSLERAAPQRQNGSANGAPVSQ